MAIKLSQALRHFKLQKKEELGDFTELRRKKKEWILKIAPRYLNNDEYMAFALLYISNRSVDNRKAYPIAQYIQRRYNENKKQYSMDRDKSRIHRRQQIKERSDD